MKLNIISFLVLICQFCAYATTYYVSPSGNDINSGLSPAQAWRSLVPVNAIQTTINGGEHQILFERGGVYRGAIALNAGGISFTQPITYGAYGSGDKPQLLGSMALSGWSNSGSDVWTLNPGQVIGELFMNGKRLISARYPNAGYLTIGAGSSETNIIEGSLGMVNLTGGRLVVRKQNDWIKQGSVINQSGNNIGISIGSNIIGVGKGFYVDKVLSALDIAGEWYQDPTTFLITVKMPGGANPNSQSFEGSIHDNGISGGYKYNLKLENLTFQYYKKRGFSIGNCGGITVEKCQFKNIGETGIFLQGEANGVPLPQISTRDIVVDSCTFYDINSIALQIEWFKNMNITRNIAKRIGIIAGYELDGLNYGMGFYLTSNFQSSISYNNIDSTGYSNLVWQGEEVVIERNEMSNNGLTKNDNGFIQAFGGKVRNNIIRENILHDGFGNEFGVSGHPNPTLVGAAEGIYFDAYTINNTISGNTIYNSKNGIFVQSSQNFVIRENTTYNCYWNGLMHHEYSLASNDQTDGSSNDVSNIITKKNIFYSVRPSQNGIRWSSDRCNSPFNFGVSDSNYVFNPYSATHFTMYKELCPGNTNGQNFTLTQWQSMMNQEQHSKTNTFLWNGNIISTTGSNLLPNGNFDTDISGGWYGNGGGGNAAWESNPSLNGGTFKASQTSGGANGYAIESPNMAVQAGKQYVVSFSIVGNRNGIIRPEILTKHPDYNYSYSPGNMQFSTQRSDYQFVFSTNNPLDAGNYGLFLKTQASGDVVWVDNISVYEVTSLQPDAYLDRSKLFVNKQLTAQTFNLGGNVYTDLDGNQVCGSITVAPFRSRILILQSEGDQNISVTGTNTPLCTGQKAVLTVSGYAGSLIWQESTNGTDWNNVTSGNGANGYVYTTAGLSATTYFRAAIISTVCPNFFSNPVVVSVTGASPNVLVSANPICQGQNVVMTITGVAGSNVLWRISSNNIVWSDANTGPPNTNRVYTAVGLNQNTWFNVSVNGVCGTYTTPTFVLTVNPNVNPAFGYGWPTCNNLNLPQSGGFSNASIGYYSTTTLGVSVNSITGLISASTVTGNIYIKYTKYADGACSETVTTTSVNLLPTPTAGFSPGLSFCANLPFTIQAIGASSYTWAKNGFADPVVSDVISVPGVYPYGLSVVDGNGCRNNFAQAVVTILGNPLPTISGTAALTYCQYAPSSATDITNKVSGTDLRWYNVSVSGAFTTVPGAPGTSNAGNPVYSLWVSKGNGTCESPRLKFDINVNPSAVSNINPVGSTSICQGEIAVLTSTSAVNNQWYKNGQTIAGANAQFLSVSVPGIYNLKVGSGLCTDTVSVGTKVTITPLPNTSLSISPALQEICTGAGANLTINNSEVGVIYQVMYTSGILGTTVAGTGSNIQFTIPGDNLTVGGNAIRVKATGISVNASDLASINTSAPPVIDGELNESTWSLSKTIAKCVDNQNGGTCPSNNTMTFGTSWDNTYLYVGVKVIDANVNYNPNVNFWDTDAVEIYIDGDNNKGGSYDIFDKQYILRYGDSNHIVFEKSNSSLGTVSGSGLLFEWKNTSNGYTMEVAIPWARIGISAPAIGTSIGFDIGNNDNDNGINRWTQTVYAGFNNNAWDNRQFANLPFIGSQTFCSGSVNLTTQAEIQVNPTPVQPTLNYGNAPVCNSLGTINASFTGTGGGTFSANNGLTINPTDGSVTVTGFSGVYTVQYNKPAAGGCGSLSSSATLTITSAPVQPVFNYSSGRFCNSAPQLTPVTVSGISGGAFTATGGLPVHSVSGIVSSSGLVGIFDITYLVPSSGGCSSVAGISTITLDGVNSQPGLVYASPVCKTSTSINPSGSNLSGGVYSYTSAGANVLEISTLTGVVNPSLSNVGNYTIIYTKGQNGACPAVSTTTGLTINSEDIAMFTYPSATICNISPGSIFPSVSGQTLGGTYTYTTSGSNTLSLQGATGEIIPTLSGAGNYAIKYQTTSLCATTHHFNLSVATNPVTADFSFGNTPFCNNLNNQGPTGTIQTLSVVSSTGTGTLVWADQIQGTVNIKASGPDQAFTIRNVVSIPGCGTDTKYATLTILSAPVLGIVANPSRNICRGDMLTLSGLGATSYSWSGGITNNVGLNPTASAMYTLTGSNAANCQSTTVVGITVNNKPVITINATPSVSALCQGESIVFSANGANAYSWTNGIINNVSYTPTSTSIYTVTGTDLNGCTGKEQISITLKTIPGVPEASNPATICMGQRPPVFTAMGTNLKWYSTSNGGTGASTPPTISNQTAQTFNTYVSQTINGCESTARLHLTAVVKPLPTVEILNVNNLKQVCEGTNISLKANALNSGAAPEYLWQINESNTSNNSSDFAITSLQPGEHRIQVIVKPSESCESITTISGNTITVTVSGAPTVSSITYNGQTTGTFCKSGSVDAVISGNGNGVFSASKQVKLNRTTGAIDLENSAVGTYEIVYTISGQGGCNGANATAYINITAPSAINIEVPGISPDGICEEMAIEIIANSSKDNVISWMQKNLFEDDSKWVPIEKTNQDPLTLKTLPLVESAHFQARSTITQCSALVFLSNVITVNVSKKSLGGIANYIDASPEEPQAEICADKSSTQIFLDKYRGKIQWHVANDTDTTLFNTINETEFPTAQDSVLQTPSVFEFNNYKLYRAIVKNGTCPETRSNIVKIRTCKRSDFVPNAFTPNTYDKNSTWDISGLKIPDEAEVSIFNRYGTEVFYASGKAFKATPWDGGNLPAGTYYYIIKRSEDAVFTGDLTIIK